MFTVANGDRPSAPNVIVLLSDGLTNIRVEHTLHEARRAKNDGIHIIPVGEYNTRVTWYCKEFFFRSMNNN